MTPSDEWNIYSTFIDAQLKAEQDRRTSLDERGAKLQQSASVTIGLFVTALGMVLVKGQGIPLQVLLPFIVTVTLLIWAFYKGVQVTRLIDYVVADSSTMEDMLKASHWGDSTAVSRNYVAYLNIQTINDLRPGNNEKADALSKGLRLQGLGVVAGSITFAAAAATSLLSWP